jgi:hypothetical protein
MHDSGASRREIAKSRLEYVCCLKIESGNQFAVDVRGRWSTCQTALRDLSHITANWVGLVSLIEQREISHAQTRFGRSVGSGLGVGPGWDEKPDAGIERSNGDRSAAQRRRGAAICGKAVATTTE